MKRRGSTREKSVKIIKKQRKRVTENTWRCGTGQVRRAWKEGRWRSKMTCKKREMSKLTEKYC